MKMLQTVIILEIVPQEAIIDSFVSFLSIKI